jgi:hypothetical protein
MGDDIIVEGNFGGKVITEPFLYSGKEQMERLLASFKGTGLHCYNCSNGVKINGAIPLHAEDLLIMPSSLHKEDVIGNIKAKGFIPLKEMDVTSFLDFEAFQNICETAIDILNTPAKNRGEALDKIIKQLRYLNSFQENRYLHLYLLLEGEFLYINGILISLLYDFGDDTTIMPYFNEALAHWIDFLKQAPQAYKERWNKESTHKFNF